MDRPYETYIYFFFLSHLNQHIKKEKQIGSDVSPYVAVVSEVENMLGVGEVRYFMHCFGFFDGLIHE